MRSLPISTCMRQILRSGPTVRLQTLSQIAFKRAPTDRDSRYGLHLPSPQQSYFHSSTRLYANSITADEVMEDLTDLYATAKDEFEIAAEETEKKTIYAADDREAAREALTILKQSFQKAVSQAKPDVAKEIQSRVGQRIRELENAITAMEESAMED